MRPMIVVSLITLSNLVAINLAQGYEKTLKWDKFVESEQGTQIACMGGFVQGEAFAVRFEAGFGDYPIVLKRIELAFAGNVGEPSVTKTMGLKIFHDAGATNVSDANLLYSGDVDITSIDTSSGVGEVEQLPAIDLTSQTIVVEQGGVRVAFYHNHSGTPSICADGYAGNVTIVPKVNFIYAVDPFNPSTYKWYYAEQLGVNGNWIMRLVIEAQGSGGDDVIVEPDVLEPMLEIYSISPTQGFNDEPTAVTIAGKGFKPGLAVYLGNNQIPNQYVTSITNTSISATVPSGLPPATYDLIVENPDGSSASLPAAFTVLEKEQELIVDSVIPDKGYNDEPTDIMVLGSGFKQNLALYLGATKFDEQDIKEVTDQKILAVVQPGMKPGSYDLMVENPDGKIAVLSDAFEVLEKQVETPGPKIVSIDPDWGSPISPTDITIMGQYFQEGALVTLDAKLLTSQFIDEKTLTAQVPEGMDPGSYSITVTNPDGQSDVLPTAFKVYPICTQGQAVTSCICGNQKVSMGQYCCNNSASLSPCAERGSGGCSVSSSLVVFPFGLIILLGLWLIWILLKKRIARGQPTSR